MITWWVAASTQITTLVCSLQSLMLVKGATKEEIARAQHSYGTSLIMLQFFCNSAAKRQDHTYRITPIAKEKYQRLIHKMIL